MKPLRYVDAVKIKQALNFAGPDPMNEVTRKLSEKEWETAIAAVDAATLPVADCKHLDWEWLMARCPDCGCDDVRRKY